MHNVKLHIEFTPRDGSSPTQIVESPKLSNRGASTFTAALKVVKINPKIFCLTGKNEIYVSMEKAVDGKSITAQIVTPWGGVCQQVLFLATAS